jgi:hypothetical protein
MDNRTRNGFPGLWVRRVRQGEVEALRLNTILGMLVAKHVRRAVLGDDPAGKSGHDDRSPDKGSVGKFLMVSDGAHTSNSGLAVVKHPIIHDRFCGHKQCGGAAAKATKLPERDYRKHQLPRPVLFRPVDDRWSPVPKTPRAAPLGPERQVAPQEQSFFPFHQSAVLHPSESTLHISPPL